VDTTKILERLRDERPDGPLAGLCAIAVDHLLSQPVGALIDPPRLAEQIYLSLTGPGVEATISRHIRPAVERALDRAETRGERVGDYLPPEVVSHLEALLSEPVSLDPEQVRKAVAGDSIQQLLAVVIQETLGRFIKAGEGGGLRGLVGWGAGKLRDAGKGLFSGIGKDLLDSSIAPIQEKLVERVLSPETAKSLGKARARFFKGSLKQPVADARRLPREELLTLAPKIVRHNLARPEVRQMILDEIGQALAAEGPRPLREALSEAGLLERVRGDLVALTATQAQGLVRSEAFAGWLESLLG
jgi:hypothetical protein